MRAIAEYFLLREARAAASKIAEAERVALRGALAVARQRAQAATALWSNGHSAEGLRLAVEALEAMLGAAGRSGAGEGDGERAAPWKDALAAQGVSADTLAAIAEAERRARDASLPRLDREVQPAHVDLYHDLVRARIEIERVLARAAASPRDLIVIRNVRVATAALVAVLVLSGVALAARRSPDIRADASDTFGGSPLFAPARAFDGNPTTEWLLSDRTTGWLEARLPAPQRVSRVTLLNARNAPHFDRATRAYRVELYAGDRLVRSVEGEFERYDPNPAPRVVPIAGDGITRVRFVVLSFHQLGGGLAEMEIDE